MEVAKQMASWLYTVQVEIDPDVEDEWNEWYGTVHVPEMVECPGWISGARYVNEDESGRHYVSVYELEGPEALRTDEFRARRGWGKFADRLSYQARLYRPVDAP